MTKILPRELTSYDLLKAFAVIIMVVDHVGYYFFPDQMWYRSIGRIGFPIWFFLIGHARGRDLPLKLWGGAAILVAANAVTGMYIFPMNALVTIIAIRLLLDPYIRLSMMNIQGMVAFSVALFVLIMPTNMFTEYGTEALIMAVFGYLVRHREGVKDAAQILPAYMLFAVLGFLAMQAMIFKFSQPQWMFTITGTMVVMAALFIFKSATFPKLTKMIPFPFVWLIQLMGRRTLEIYVLHLLVFKFAAFYLFKDMDALFDWTLFYPLPDDVASSVDGSL